MRTLTRWARFNFVGAVGMAVQLTTLAVLQRVVPGHELCATAAAVEVTLLHNFIWHLHFTWPDRPGAGAWLQPLLRFQLSSGMVSLLGNVVLTSLLVRGTHLPLLLANLVAIVVCSTANFLVGNNWAFAPSPRTIVD